MDDDDHFIYVVDCCVSALSAAGCIFIIGMYCAYEKLRTFSFKLVRDLAIINLIGSMVWWLPIDNDITCEISGIGHSLMFLCNIFWCAVISRSLYIGVVKMEEIDEKTYARNSIIPILGVSFVLSFLPYVSYWEAGDPYGLVGGWCWILVDSDNIWGSVWRFFAIIVPFVIVFAYICYVSYTVIEVVNEELEEYEEFEAERKELTRRLLYYPLVLVVCYFPSGVLHALNAIEPDIDRFYIMLVVGILSSMNGFLNSIVYGLNPSVKESFKATCSGPSGGYAKLEDG